MDIAIYVITKLIAYACTGVVGGVIIGHMIDAYKARNENGLLLHICALIAFIYLLVFLLLK